MTVRRLFYGLVMALLWLGVSPVAFSQAPETSPATTPPMEEDRSEIDDLPALVDMSIPTAETLLSKEPVTWIILKEERVIVCGPVRPRPSTLQSLLDEQAKLREWLQLGQGTTAERAATIEKIATFGYIRGTLLENVVNPEFRLQTSFIKEIWHHEDLILKRAGLQLDQGDLRTAFELLFRLQQIDANWPGLEGAQQRFLLLDAEQSLAADRIEFALVRLEELFARNPQYEGLSATLGTAVDRLVAQSVEAEQYREGRHFLGRLRQRIPEHPTVVKWETDLQSRMQSAMAEARASADAREFSAAVDSIDEAARIWPNSVPLRDLYRQLKLRYQRIRCGVLTEPSPTERSFPFETDLDRRRREWESRPLFEPAACPGTSQYRTTWFEQWEPTELGRNLVLDLRSQRESWSPEPILTAIDLQHALAARLSPSSPLYDERLDGYVRRVSVRSPFRLEMEFERVPLRLEAALSLALQQPSMAADDASPWLTRFFRPADPETESNVFIRDRPEPDESVQFHIAEIRERSYETEEALLQGTFRGEVDFLPRVPLWGVQALRDDPEWVVQRLQLPEVHLLQFHPDSEPAGSQELRRALYFALEREQLLKQVVLSGADPSLGRLTSAPFPKSLHAFRLGVREPEPDFRVALSLALAARKGSEETPPPMKLTCEPDPSLVRTAREMIRAWQRIGVEVVLVEDPSAQGDWDIVYRRVAIHEPMTQLWPLLTQQSQARVADLQGLPGWLRQKLIDLELTTNWETAVLSMQAIHADLWSEMFVIPLWEVDRFLAHRRTIRGIPPTPLRTFQNLESWVAEPWLDAGSL